MSAGCVFGLRGTHAGSGVELTFDARAVVFDTDRALIAEDRDLYTDVYVAELTAPSAAYAFAVKPLSVDFGERPLGSAVTRNSGLVTRARRRCRCCACSCVAKMWPCSPSRMRAVC
jgi:hypothetical protein